MGTILLGCLVVATVVPSNASAREPAGTRIVIVPVGPDDPFAARLRADLTGLGFRVEIAEEQDAPPSRGALESLARETNSVAAVRIVREPTGLEIWVFDRITGKAVTREIVRDGDPDSRTNASVVALRAVELLRASLLELSHSSEAPYGEVPMTAPVQALTEGTRVGAFRFALGPTVLFDPSLSTPEMLVFGSVSWLPGRFGVGALALVPVRAGMQRENEGVARLRRVLVATTVDVRLAVSPRWEVVGGIGGGVVRTSIEGNPSPPYAGRTEILCGGILLARVAGAIRVTRHLGLTLEMFSGLTVPGQTMRFAGREIGALGRPLIGAALAIQVRWDG